MNRWMVAAVGVALAAAVGFVVASADEAKDPEGKTLVLKYKCNSCHSIEAAGIVKKAASDDEEGATASKKKTPDLSSVGLTAKADWIAKFLKKQETTKAGKKHVKLFKGTDDELKTVSAWLETMKSEKAGKAESTEKVEKSEGAAPDVKAETAEKTEPKKAAEKTETEKAPEGTEGAQTK